jgi:hypothetical protein
VQKEDPVLVARLAHEAELERRLAAFGKTRAKELDWSRIANNVSFETGEIKDKEHTKQGERLLSHRIAYRFLPTRTGNYTERFLGDRSYLTFVPFWVSRRVSLQMKVALFVVFHDKQGTSWLAALHQSGWSRRTLKNDQIVVYLQSRGREPSAKMKCNGTWHTTLTVDRYSLADDVTYTSAVLDELLLRHYLIDRRQIYFVGYGDGATFALRAAAEFHRTVAAVAMFGGGLSRADTPILSSLARIPPLFIATTPKVIANVELSFLRRYS